MLVEPHRHMTLAMMICEAWTTQDIADAMCLDADVVKKYAGGQGPQGFNKILAALRQKMANYSIERRYKLAEKAEKCYQRIENALDGNDLRLASDTAWRILDEVSPKAAAPTAGMNLSVNLTQNNQTNNLLLELTKDLFGEFSALKKDKTISFEKHLRTGIDALPGGYKEVARQLDLSPDGDEDEEEVVDVLEGTPAPFDAS